MKRAIDLAEERGARRTAARARLQLASLHQFRDQPAEAIAIIDKVLPFLRENNYRRFELLALSIAARSHERLDNLEQARAISSNVLSVADTLKDEAQVALAAANLASVMTALGDYPEALRLRERAESIRRKQGDNSLLPYDLANRAELLIRLGRDQEAGKVLADLEAGIAAKIEAYVGRSRRAVFLRALAATTMLQCDEALRLVAHVQRDGTISDSAGTIAPALAAFCHARTGKRLPPSGRTLSATERILARERHYWLAAAALERGDPQGALTEVTQGLALLGTMSNDELRWRLAAIGASAARELRNQALEREMFDSARTAFDRVRAGWKVDFNSYQQRADLLSLRKRSSLA